MDTEVNRQIKQIITLSSNQSECINRMQQFVNDLLIMRTQQQVKVEPEVIVKTADEIIELEMDLEHERIMRNNFYKWLAIIIKKYGGRVDLTDDEIREFMAENYEVEIMENFDNGRTLVVNRRFSE